MAGGVATLTTTFGAVVSAAVGCLWRPGRRSPLKVLASLGPWGEGGRGGVMADLRMKWLLNSGFLPFPLFLITLSSLFLVSSISLSLPSPFLPDEGQRSDRKFASLYFQSCCMTSQTNYIMPLLQQSNFHLQPCIPLFLWAAMQIFELLIQLGLIVVSIQNSIQIS